MHSLDSPFLVNYYGAYFQEDCVRVVMELMNMGSIRDLINELKDRP